MTPAKKKAVPKKKASTRKKSTAVKAKKAAPKKTAVKRSSVKKGVTKKAAPKKKKTLSTSKGSSRTTSVRKTPKKSAAKPARKKTARRKLLNYTPRSRYSTYRVGDQVRFEKLRYWDGEREFENIVGTVIDKIQEKKLGLKFIEIEFDFSDYLPYSEYASSVRRFIVK